MKHLWKTLTLGLIFVFTAIAFTACGSQINASIEDENTNNLDKTLTIEVPNQQTTETSHESESKNNHNHNFSGWEIIKTSTCIEHGLKVRHCDCGETETCELPLVEHNFVFESETAPTCTEPGYIVYRCTVCQCVHHKETEPAYRHQIEDHIITEPTCGTTGKSVHYCTRCHQDLEEFETSATGEHEYEPTIIAEPTCTQPGKIIYQCHCGAIDPDREEDILPTKHQYDEHTHDCICGAQQPPLENLADSYWYTEKFVILFESFEASGADQYTGTYTSFAYVADSDTHIGEPKSAFYSGTYTLTYGTKTVIHLDNTGNDEHNLKNENNLTYQEFSNDGKVTYQLSGILFTKNKNCTLTFMGYEVK